ncbi:winged helix-turn-helix transcriptional regulator [Streptomyces fructofermentans]|uniref:winged helix-turn-helix transcriptional regulator n=1 Tax=Streptomyces fructofermentans TaxID=152141 RepID=UPI0033F3C210
MTDSRMPRVSSIADALEVVGDRWSLLIVREVSFGAHRFGEIQANTGAPAATLTQRLRKLERAAVIERQPYSGHPKRHEYILTAVGEDLLPVLAALGNWGARHVKRPVVGDEITERPRPTQDS